MSAALDTGGQRAHRPRHALIDIARGVAIIAMIVYHGAWDLWHYQFIAVDVPFHPGWIVFQRTILSTFLFLVGTGLVLGHGDGIRWASFGRRFGFIVAGALLVSAGTYAFSPDTFVYFGILHAIALFSLLGLAFLRAPVWLNAALGLVFLLLPLFVQSPIFSPKPLSWIGLWDEPPFTEDLVPLFPWFGVVLIGIAATRLAQAHGVLERIGRINPRDRASRALAFMGRWSLVIYLVHQPILLAIIVPLAMWLEPHTQMRVTQFYGSCVASCQSSSGDNAGFCTAYCQCTLDRVEADNLWTLLEQGTVRTAQEDELVLDLANQCAAEALEGGPAALEP